MAELISGYQASAVLGALARLGVADALADGPATSTELAQRLGADSTPSSTFPTAVPRGGDAYLLSWILHDWDDATALRILGQCRAAMEATARLLVVEMVVPEPHQPDAAAFQCLIRQTDLEMLAVVGGRERTAAEYGELLSAPGFSLSRIVPLEGMPWSVIEGVAV